MQTALPSRARPTRVPILALLLAAAGLVAAGLPQASASGPSLALDDAAAGTALGAVLPSASLVAPASSVSPGLPTTSPQGNWKPVYGPVVVNGEAYSAGTGLRNQGSGTILLPGLVGVALKAYLYWEIQEPAAMPASSVAVLNGVPVVGTLIGSGPDLCWGAGTNWAYRADVTSLILGPGPYTVSTVSGSATGTDPWVFGSTFPMAEGASLVVVTPDPRPHEVVIVDGYESLIGTSKWAAIPRVTPSVWPSALATIGGDGQLAAPDSMDWNGLPLASGSWDGSDPQAAPAYTFGDLWDTDHFSVYAPPGINVLDIHGTGDCIGPEAFVLSTPLEGPCPARVGIGPRGIVQTCDPCPVLAQLGLSCEVCTNLSTPVCDPCELLRQLGLSCNPCERIDPCDPCGIVSRIELQAVTLGCDPCDTLASFNVDCDPCGTVQPCDPCGIVQPCDPCGPEMELLLCRCLPPKVPRLKECLLPAQAPPAATQPARS